MEKDFLAGMFGGVQPGCCKLSVTGGIAVKTGSGEYKTYNVEKGKLINCDNFVFGGFDSLFWIVPTRKVKRGDIIISGGKPRCVVEVGGEEIKVVNCEDNTIETMIPERHVFLGNAFFYGKIVSLFGSNPGKGKGFGRIMKYMMLSGMLKKPSGQGGTAGGFMGAGDGMSLGNMLPLMLMCGKGGLDEIFADMFDLDAGDEDGNMDDFSKEEA